tara:strand:+ start:918 stop:1829 length:912 start_codon:yes stop_codon:yes gene_type:complete
MGFWDWLTGDDDPEPVNYAQTSVADIPGYIKEPSERLMAASEGLAGQAYDPYGGDRLAGLQPDMLQAMQDTRDQAGIGALRGTEAYNMGMGSGRDIAQADIARYTNPYLTDVAGQTERELRRAAEQQGIASSAQAQKAGAFGGSRHGIIDAERGRNLEQNVGDVYAKTYAQGHESALEQFNKQRDFERQGALTGAQVASQGQNMGFQDISQRMGIGSLQQGQEQAGYDLAYGNFKEEQQHPYEQANFMRSMLSGTPYSTTTTTTGTQPGTPTTGFFQQAAGLGIAGLGAASDWKRAFDPIKPR